MQANKALLLSNMLSSTNSVENADIASFEASCVTPLDITVDIDPVQDLHGYDNPWPGGGGKNLFDKTKVANVAERLSVEQIDNGFKITNLSTGTYKSTSFYADFAGHDGATVYLKGNVSNSGSNNGYFSVRFYDDTSELTTGATRVELYSNRTSHKGTVPTGTTRVVFVIYGTGSSSAAVGDTSTFTNVIFSLSNDAYSPYSNVCPISGWDRAKVTRTGRNLYARENGEYNVPVFDTNGVPARYPDVNAVWIKVLPNTTYTVSNIGPISQMYYVRWINCDKNKKFISRPGGTYTNESLPVTFTTPSNCEWVEIAINQYDTNHISKNDWIVQVEEGSTAHAYEPYTAVTHEIPFSTSVYGGKLNVETGELVVNRKMIDLGTLNWNAAADSGRASSSNRPDNLALKSRRNDIIINQALCNKYRLLAYYKTGASSDEAYAVDYSIAVIGSTSGTIFVKDPSIASFTAAQVKSAMTGVQFCYELATPITLTLDPVEINSLIGENNVWSDTGNVSVRNITCNADVLELLLKTKLIGDC